MIPAFVAFIGVLIYFRVQKAALDGIDQVFFRRPVPGYANYRTPVRGLYLCGASVHPGGGVTGVPGHNAAREILKDLKK